MTLEEFNKIAQESRTNQIYVPSTYEKDSMTYLSGILIFNKKGFKCGFFKDESEEIIPVLRRGKIDWTKKFNLPECLDLP